MIVQLQNAALGIHICDVVNEHSQFKNRLQFSLQLDKEAEASNSLNL